MIRQPRPLHPLRWLAGLLGALLVTLALAQAPLAVPALTAHVVDTTGTLDIAQRQQLERRLSALEQDRGAQVVVLLVPTTQPEDIASYANRVANTWKIGRRDIGDGVLLVVAKNDRRVRIEVAKTLEGAIPDLAANRLIDEALAPRFRQGDFAGGLEAAAEQIAQLIAGEALPLPAPANAGAPDDLSGLDLALFLLLAVPVLALVARNVLGPRLGALATGAASGALALTLGASLLIATLAVLAGFFWTLLAPFARRADAAGWDSGRGGHFGARGGHWGGGHAGAGGGGFSAGGGGDFGGGGASGDW